MRAWVLAGAVRARWSAGPQGGTGWRRADAGKAGPSRTREREGERDAGPAGKRSGPTGACVARKVGPQGLVCWARERVELGLALGRAAWVGKGAGWAATGFGLGFLFWFSFLFLLF